MSFAQKKAKLTASPSTYNIIRGNVVNPMNNSHKIVTERMEFNLFEIVPKEQHEKLKLRLGQLVKDLEVKSRQNDTPGVFKAQV